MDRADRRVVVTGMGMVTPVGLRRGDDMGGAARGPGRRRPDHAVRREHVRDADRGRVEGLRPGTRPRHRRGAVGRPLPHHAARAGRRDAGGRARRAVRGPGIDPTRFGVYLGSGEGQQDFPRFVELVHRSTEGGEVDKAVFTGLGFGAARPDPRGRAGAGHAGRPPGGRLRRAGPNLTCLTACAASAQAIGEAVEVIRRGAADVMLTGGTHSMIHPFGLTGFILLTAMSTRNDDPAHASRPFDRDRDGFVLGEGGGMLVLEELEHARARGAVIHGEVAGHASTADAFRLTDSHDEGRGAVAAMRLALADAGLDPDDVDYINAHGTSTKVNDSVETLAIKRVFGRPRATRFPISSTKSMTGHLVAAGGAVEAIVCLLAIRDGVVPPTINLEHPRPGLRPRLRPATRPASSTSTSPSPTASASAARTRRWSSAGSPAEVGGIAIGKAPLPAHLRG